jgi:hypothetical protein
MAKQLSHMYSCNRRAVKYFHLLATSLNGRLKDKLETTLQNQHLKWTFEWRTEEIDSFWSGKSRIDKFKTDGGVIRYCIGQRTNST